MKKRCYYTKDKAYPDYGGRGIKVCDRWLDSFENFWADMSAGYSDDLEIDRININGDYCPENCRWVDKKTQCRNTRQNHYVDSPLGRMTIAELAEKTGIAHGNLRARVRKGLTGDKLIKGANICSDATDQ